MSGRPIEIVGGGGTFKIGTPFVIGAIEVNGTVYPVYRKIIDFGALPNNTNKDVASGITPNQILSLHGVAKYSSNDTTLPLPQIAHDGNGVIELVVTSSLNIRITTYSDRTAFNVLVTIEYY